MVELLEDITMQSHTYDYDLFVIGGGSGGISAARHAAAFGKKVALADFVKPSPAGSKWGLGGTCVNVGCIPKKLMHYSGILNEMRHDQKAAGIPIAEQAEHNWEALVGNVQKHIKGLNWGYKTELVKSKVKYLNYYASFVDEHTLKLNNDKEEKTVTADKIVIATGGRPSYPGISGDKELGISSDDVFQLKNSPGKTLIIGASYIALECGGFLTSLGYDTTIMVRSILLRGFDQALANKIGDHMRELGTKFINEATPTKLEKNGKKITVYYNHEGSEK